MCGACLLVVCECIFISLDMFVYVCILCISLIPSNEVFTQNVVLKLKIFTLHRRTVSFICTTPQRLKSNTPLNIITYLFVMLNGQHCTLPTFVTTHTNVHRLGVMSIHIVHTTLRHLGIQCAACHRCDTPRSCNYCMSLLPEN